jgi:hypothetical protein
LGKQTNQGSLERSGTCGRRFRYARTVAQGDECGGFRKTYPPKSITSVEKIHT